MGIVKVSKLILIFSFVLSAVFLGGYFFSRNKKCRLCFLVLFLILNIGFNLLLIADPIIDRTHQNVLSDLRQYYQTHQAQEHSKPIFLWAEDLSFYFGIPGRNIALITDPALRAYAQSIGYTTNGYYYMRMVDKDSLQVLEQQGGIVFSLYYPVEYTLDVEGGRKEEYDYLTSHCKLLESFDYPHAKGVVFAC